MDKLTPDPLAALRRCYACIPLACEAEVATEIQQHVHWAITEIIRLRDLSANQAAHIIELQRAGV